ncbi:MAG: GNAT family N-acetyltransferase [Candidatus Thorarchaeota archaeon]|jgi:ribosomal protein S18 acetylase RimI-like enzyme
MEQPIIKPVQEEDREWVRQVSIEHWASEIVVTRNSVYLVEEQPGFIALLDKQRVGLATYRIEFNICEILTLNSLVPGRGIGSMLLNAVEVEAKNQDCKRIWVITTNNNLEALGFYQKRGYAIKAIHSNAIEKSRRLKPEIPLVAENGIPIRDEIELEKFLA